MPLLSRSEIALKSVNYKRRERARIWQFRRLSTGLVCRKFWPFSCSACLYAEYFGVFDTKLGTNSSRTVSTNTAYIGLAKRNFSTPLAARFEE